jgi:hypothetical protein
MSEASQPNQMEPVSEAVRRTMQRLADVQALGERLKEKVRESELIQSRKSMEPPKSSRSGSMNATPVGVACSPQVAAVFARGDVNPPGLLQTPVLVDRRLTPANTEFFYDADLWARRRTEQETWERTHPAQT